MFMDVNMFQLREKLNLFVLFIKPIWWTIEKFDDHMKLNHFMTLDIEQNRKFQAFVLDKKLQ